MKVEGVNITGVTSDSGSVKEGFAFVAIKGLNRNGNEFIDEAIKRGASIIFSEDELDIDGIPTIRVENSRRKLIELLNEFYDYPSQKLILIGITGTNGKTSTSYILEHILRTSGYNTGIIGTLGIRYSNKYIFSNLTTPEPETLFSILHDMVKEKVEIAIMEVSSHALKLSRVLGLDFNIAIHTNIDYDHMNFHKSKADYINSKKLLFDSLKKNRISIINMDDREDLKLIEGNSNTIVVTYGLNTKASITASSIKLSDCINFNLYIQRGITALNGTEIEPMEQPISIGLIGRHNVYNSLAAISGALCIGVQPSEIENSLKSYNGIPRRLNKIYDKEFLVIDDFSHNPMSYEAVFETIQSLDFNKLIIVNAIRGNRGVDINRRNAKVISSWCSTIKNYSLILTLSKDVTKEADDVKQSEVLAYKEVLDELEIDYLIFHTLKDSILKALEIVNRRDLILLLGAQGMEKGNEILAKYIDFN